MKQESWVQTVKKKSVITVTVLGIGFLGCCLAAWLCCIETIGLQGADILSKVIWMAGIFGGCYAAARSSMRRRLLVALGEATAILMVLLLAKILFLSGEEWDNGWMIMVGETMAAVAGLLASKEKSRKRK